MTTTTLDRIRKWTAWYLIATMAFGAWPTANALVATAGIAVSAVVGFTGTAMAANEPEPSKSFTIYSSKPPIWVNYADPKPKGGGEDKGAQPSYYPVCSVNNADIILGAEQPLLSVNVPVGSLSMSPSLTYSPPVTSRSLNSTGTDYDYSICASPSAFGNCWSDNLTPCLEYNAEKTTEGSWTHWEYTFSYSGPATPSASFRLVDTTWKPQILTKADIIKHDDANGIPIPDYVNFWGSGISVPFSGCSTWTDNSWSRGRLSSTITYYWPNSIADRNDNQLQFEYDTFRGAPFVRSLGAVTSSDYSFRPVPFLKSVGHNRSGAKVDFNSEVKEVVLRHQQDVSDITTNILLCNCVSQNVEGSVIKTSIEYDATKTLLWQRTLTNATPYTLYYPIRLISRIVLPDGSDVKYEYAAQSAPSELAGTFNLYHLSRIVAPGRTTDISYSDFNWVGPADSQKWLPGSIVIAENNGAISNAFFRGPSSYNFEAWLGSATMTTRTSRATTNIKSYNITHDFATKQWYGVEVSNTLDDVAQNMYSANARFLFTAASNSPNGSAWFKSTFEYDGHENLVKATDDLGNWSSNEYAANGLDLVLSRDPRGIITTNVYDDAGNLRVSVQDIDGLALVSSNIYNAAGQPIKSFDPLDRPTYNFYTNTLSGDNRFVPQAPSAYDSISPSPVVFGHLVATRDPEGRITTYSYDRFGRQTVVNSPGNNGARYAVTNTLDIMGRVTNTFFPDGTFAVNVYNAAGYLARARDRNDRWTTNHYDGAGHLTRVDLPNGDWIEKKYEGTLITELRDGAGNITKYHYDHEQLVFVEFPDGSTRAAGFDNLAQQLWAVDERGVAVTNSYDSLGRLKGSAYVPYVPEHTMPADVTDLPGGCTPTTCQWDMVHGGFTGQTISYNQYDAGGNLLSMTDWAGTYTNDYDALSRPVFSLTDYSGNHGFLYTITSVFDRVGNLVTNGYAIAANGVTAWQQNILAYDDLNRLESQITSIKRNPSDTLSPIGAAYTYNSNNKLASFVASLGGNTRHTTTYSYDKENRLSAITNEPIGDSAISLVYQYNNAQQITRITETANEYTEFTYDGRDQLRSETNHSSTAALQYTKEYAYDLAQNRTGSLVTVAGDFIPSAYYHQPANKLEAISDIDDDGLSLADEALNGTSPCASDTDGDSIDDDDEVTANTCPFSADSDGDAIPDDTDTQPLRPNGTVWHGADSPTPPANWWQSSTSKPKGNLKSYANHQYYYDRAGNLSTSIVNGVTTVFRYNVQNKLVKIEQDGDTLYEFVYDSQNRRIGIKKGADPWRYDLHAGMVCFASLTIDGESATLDKFFVRSMGIAEGTGDIVAEIDGTGSTPTHFLVANHRGDIVRAISSDGSIIEAELRYDSFGNPMYESGTFTPRYTFSTKEYLYDVQLYIYAYRVYDPVAGRWTQRDPIDYQDSVNLYQFCGNNPVNRTDADGCAIVTDPKLNNSDSNSVEKALADLNKQPAGNNLVKNAKTNSFVVVITVTNAPPTGKNPNGTRPDTWNDATNGKGTGATIFWDPNRQDGGKDDAGSTKRPPFVGLGHELGHAKDMASGTASKDQGTGVKNTTPPAETGAMKAEQDIRKENGLTNRTHYYR